MTKREKRLKKGISSLDKQIELHEKKKKLAAEIGEEDLVGYYTKEIDALKKRKENRKSKLGKT